MLFIAVILYVVPLISITVDKIVFKGKWEWVIYFMMLYLPVYTTILSVVYQTTSSVFITSIFQYLKEFVLLLTMLSFVLYQRNIFEYGFRLQLTDKLFLFFYLLCTLFLFLPVGSASFITKAIYFKNVSVMGLMYFFGRNTVLQAGEYRKIFYAIIMIFSAALLVNLFEKASGVHFQNFTGYASYNHMVNKVEPSGHYGLTWTFETQTGGKRLASFFSDPLDLASSCLLGFSVGLIGYLTSKRGQSWVFALLMGITTMSLFFASSRASFAAFFIMLFFIAMIFRLYGLIKIGGVILMAFGVYVLFYATDDFYFFVIDTLTFENASSVGHVLAWVEALNQMIAAPLGSGLAMSGNSIGVTDELRIGGENQYLIFGVQLGVLGMLLYIAILVVGIWGSVQAFRKTDDIHLARIAFVAATIKVGLLLPLFTANAELYAFVSWVSWWMIGLSMKTYGECMSYSNLRVPVSQ
ncbi:O-antigen ligase domain-containing protein [Echinicola sp. 20G]|uniref:O-antigen ligase domain-containing protein n=1 Tax=Echinicola sp. 20G TaxID=2781961 RepID=UPI001F1B8F2C|nr:O-antigen ligase domain-containing protein [Echinicola sp. 20G]